MSTPFLELNDDAVEMLEAVRKDAARYRFFRAYKAQSDRVFVPLHTARTAEEFDAAVDEAMQELGL